MSEAKCPKDWKKYADEYAIPAFVDYSLLLPVQHEMNRFAREIADGQVQGKDPSADLISKYTEARDKYRGLRYRMDHDNQIPHDPVNINF